MQADLRLRYDWAGKAELGYFVSGGVSYTGRDLQPAIDLSVGRRACSIPGTTLLRYRMSGYALFDASIGMQRDAWTVSLFGENLTNSHASTFTSSAQFIKSEVVVRPMTYGVKVGYTF